MLDIAVAEVGLQGAGIVSLIDECIAAGMAQHVRMRLEPQFRLSPSPFDHPREAGRGEGRPSLTDEHKGGLGLLLALEAAQGA